MNKIGSWRQHTTRASQEEWESLNPIIAKGQYAVVTGGPIEFIKQGDGFRHWKDLPWFGANPGSSDGQILTMEEIQNAIDEKIAENAADKWPALLRGSGVLDAAHSINIPAGDYEFAIMKNTAANVALITAIGSGTPSAVGAYASFCIRRIVDTTPTPCTIAWASKWDGSNDQGVDGPVNIGAGWMCTDGDLGYGDVPHVGGSHIVNFMDNNSKKLWTINAMISGSTSGTADFGSMTITTPGS